MTPIRRPKSRIKTCHWMNSRICWMIFSYWLPIWIIEIMRMRKMRIMMTLNLLMAKPRRLK